MHTCNCQTTLCSVIRVCAGLSLRPTKCQSIAQVCGNVSFVMLHVDS